MSTLNTLAFPDLEPELSKTRTMLARIPADKLEWQPHEQSGPLFTLARHIANIPTWLGIILNSDELDISVPFPPRPVASSVDELLAEFDANCEKAKADLSGASDEDLAALWTLRHGDHVISSQPKRAVIREWAFNHMVHHRAQLSIYFRLVGVPLPPLYGPSADES